MSTKLRIAVLVLFALNLVHPFVHSIEGGSLDALLESAEAWCLGSWGQW